MNRQQGNANRGQPVSGGPAASGRRNFLAEFAAMVCGGLAFLAPVGAGVWMFLDPLRRRGAAAAFLPVTELSGIPDDGVPRQFPVVADRVDAWTGFAAEPIGAVYLCRQKGSQTVEALSATCPHAGCFVEIDKAEKCFRCPCHNSRFTIDGGIVAPSPSPRAMDGLECQVGRNGAVAVKWQNFYTGIAEKVARP
jgi:menaquinol-cytochrome c reductase iron-sulfur subunit